MANSFPHNVHRPPIIMAWFPMLLPQGALGHGSSHFRVAFHSRMIIVTQIFHHTMSLVLNKVRRTIMASGIAWETELDKALSRAKSEDKEVLLDFYNPG